MKPVDDGTFDFDLSGWETDDDQPLPVLNKVMALLEDSSTRSVWRSQEVGFLSGASAAEHMIAGFDAAALYPPKSRIGSLFD